MDTTLNVPEDRPVRLVLSYPDTARALGIGRSKVYELVRDDPSFPRPIEVTPGRRGFLIAELDEWLAGKAADAKMREPA